MGLCLGSQLHGSAKYILDPWVACPFSSVSAGRIRLEDVHRSADGGSRPGRGRHEILLRPRGGHHRGVGRIKSRNLKNKRAPATSVRKDRSVNIQRNPKEGLLCLQPGSCCHTSSQQAGQPPAQERPRPAHSTGPFRFPLSKRAVIYYFLVCAPDA